MNHTKVANAWAANKSANGSSNGITVTMHTDGKYVWSYDHIVATTLADGTKVAFNCRYSVTTVRQVNSLRKVANIVTECVHTEPIRRARSLAF